MERGTLVNALAASLLIKKPTSASNIVLGQREGMLRSTLDSMLLGVSVRKRETRESMHNKGTVPSFTSNEEAGEWKSASHLLLLLKQEEAAARDDSSASSACVDAFAIRRILRRIIDAPLLAHSSSTAKWQSALAASAAALQICRSDEGKMLSTLYSGVVVESARHVGGQWATVLAQLSARKHSPPHKVVTTSRRNARGGSLSSMLGGESVASLRSLRNGIGQRWREALECGIILREVSAWRTSREDVPFVKSEAIVHGVLTKVHRLILQCNRKDAPCPHHSTSVIAALIAALGAHCRMTSLDEGILRSSVFPFLLKLSTQHLFAQPSSSLSSAMDKSTQTEGVRDGLTRMAMLLVVNRNSPDAVMKLAESLWKWEPGTRDEGQALWQLQRFVYEAWLAHAEGLLDGAAGDTSTSLRGSNLLWGLLVHCSQTIVTIIAHAPSRPPSSCCCAALRERLHCTLLKSIGGYEQQRSRAWCAPSPQDKAAIVESLLRDWQLTTHNKQPSISNVLWRVLCASNLRPREFSGMSLACRPPFDVWIWWLQAHTTGASSNAPHIDGADRVLCILEHVVASYPPVQLARSQQFALALRSLRLHASQQPLQHRRLAAVLSVLGQSLTGTFHAHGQDDGGGRVGARMLASALLYHHRSRLYIDQSSDSGVSWQVALDLFNISSRDNLDTAVADNAAFCLLMLAAAPIPTRYRLQAASHVMSVIPMSAVVPTTDSAAYPPALKLAALLHHLFVLRHMSLQRAMEASPHASQPALSSKQDDAAFVEALQTAYAGYLAHNSPRSHTYSFHLARMLHQRVQRTMESGEPWEWKDVFPCALNFEEKQAERVHAISSPAKLHTPPLSIAEEDISSSFVSLMASLVVLRRNSN